MPPTDIKQVWNELIYTQKLAATAYVFRQITSGKQSFRHLIYDQLGFKEDAYIILHSEGGSQIANVMHEYYNPANLKQSEMVKARK